MYKLFKSMYMYRGITLFSKIKISNIIQDRKHYKHNLEWSLNIVWSIERVQHFAFIRFFEFMKWS